MNKKRKTEPVEEPQDYVIKSAKNLKNKYTEMYSNNSNNQNNTNNINPTYFNPYYTSEYSQMNMFNSMQQQHMFNSMMQQNQIPSNFNPFIQPINPFIHPTQNNNMNKK